jgi:hypothetical protein
MNEHSEEQGLRVHHLMNLGGLIAVAGLDREAPDFLLGALVSVAHECQALTPEQRAQVAAVGRKKLDERVSAKRAWKSWRRTHEVHGLTLSSVELRRLIGALGGCVPADAAGLVGALKEVLGGRGDAVTVATLDTDQG